MIKNFVFIISKTGEICVYITFARLDKINSIICFLQSKENDNIYMCISTIKKTIKCIRIQKAMN
jgi:hypothetical protein